MAPRPAASPRSTVSSPPRALIVSESAGLGVADAHARRQAVDARRPCVPNASIGVAAVACPRRVTRSCAAVGGAEVGVERASAPCRVRSCDGRACRPRRARRGRSPRPPRSPCRCRRRCGRSAPAGRSAVTLEGLGGVRAGEAAACRARPARRPCRCRRPGPSRSGRRRGRAARRRRPRRPPRCRCRCGRGTSRPPAPPRSVSLPAPPSIVVGIVSVNAPAGVVDAHAVRAGAGRDDDPLDPLAPEREVRATPLAPTSTTRRLGLRRPSAAARVVWRGAPLPVTRKRPGGEPSPSRVQRRPPGPGRTAALASSTAGTASRAGTCRDRWKLALPRECVGAGRPSCPSAGRLPRLGRTAPDAAFGDVWQRPGVRCKLRSNGCGRLDGDGFHSRVHVRRFAADAQPDPPDVCAGRPVQLSPKQEAKMAEGAGRGPTR